MKVDSCRESFDRVAYSSRVITVFVFSDLLVEKDRGRPMDSAYGYRGPQACAIVGITYRQLDYWARTDLIRPSLADASGSGSQRLYSYQDLIQLRIIKQLLSGGLSLKAVRSAMIELRKLLDDDASGADLIVVGKKSVYLRDGEDLIDLLRKQQLVMGIVVSLNDLHRELDTKIVELNPPTIHENQQVLPFAAEDAGKADSQHVSKTG